MPIYEYICEQCGETLETLQRFGDPPPPECPKCGGTLRKKVSAPAFQFKGSGWYVTDYARKGADKGGDSEGKSSGSSESSSGGGGDDSSAGPVKKAEPKAEPKSDSKSESKSKSKSESKSESRAEPSKSTKSTRD
jgi:putative FmdB family regulatory protein